MNRIDRKIWWLDKIVFAVAHAIIGIVLFGIIFGIYGCSKRVIEYDIKNKERISKDNVEHWESYTPTYIVPFNFEGHKYIKNFNGGICHAESCPCKTNKLEVTK